MSNFPGIARPIDWDRVIPQPPTSVPFVGLDPVKIGSMGLEYGQDKYTRWACANAAASLTRVAYISQCWQRHVMSYNYARRMASESFCMELCENIDPEDKNWNIGLAFLNMFKEIHLDRTYQI